MTAAPRDGRGASGGTRGPIRAPRTLVKICGVRDRATVDATAAAGADFIGVVLVPSSPRFVPPTMAQGLALAIADAGAMPVAVVRLPVDPETRAALEAFPILQFHGVEEPEDILRFARNGADAAEDPRWECWKGMHFDADEVERFLASKTVSRLVVDGPDAGSGARFDHARFATLDESTRRRSMLAGGLDAANVAEAIRSARPGGVDVSSGVERARGVKDIALIQAFIDATRGA